jgi:hypothetical protein
MFHRKLDKDKVKIGESRDSNDKTSLRRRWRMSLVIMTIAGLGDRLDV